MIKEIIYACLSFGPRYFTITNIMERTLIGREPVRHKLWKLENAGLLTRVNCWETPLPGFSKGRPTKEICYRATERLIQKAATEPGHKQNTWDTMWKALRVLRKFTHGDLVTTCDQTLTNVRNFVRQYRDLGYLRQSGKRDREKVWMLARDAGPRRPLRRADEWVA